VLINSRLGKGRRGGADLKKKRRHKKHSTCEKRKGVSVPFIAPTKQKQKRGGGGPGGALLSFFKRGGGGKGERFSLVL